MILNLLRGLGPQRTFTHLALAALTALFCFTMVLYRPGATLEITVLGTGYAALAYLVVTLIIGPVKLLQRRLRRNPLNIHLRRDTGIWAGITGSVHVIFGFQMHMGGRILLYFFEDNPHHPFRPLANLFGISNYIGLIATILLLALLLLSNDLSLAWLRGPRWKLIQRFNYGLFILATAHTLGYQSVVGREAPFTAVVIVLVLGTLCIQMIGVGVMLARRAEA